MAIRVTRNDAGNCITFVGSTNPVYWNSCLEGQINEDNPNNIDVINKVRTVEEGTTIYEFFNLPYTDFQDRDGNEFVSPSDCASYITDNANVLSNVGTFVFSQNDLIDAQRDSTNTTVLFSNGDIYAVNSLHASSENDGTIKISTIRGSKDIYQKIRFYNVSINEGQLSNFNTIDAAVDRLNEVLSGTTIGSGTGNTVITATTTSSSGSFTIYGDRITETGLGATAGYTSTADAGNFDTGNGIYSNQIIDQQGEYFEFDQDQGDWTNARGVYIGLFDETTYDVADLDVDVAGNAIKGLLYTRFYPTPFTFADQNATTGKINESGFSNSPNTKTKFRLGIDMDGRGYIAHQLADSSFEVISRTENVIASGTELRMFVILPLANELNGMRNMTVNSIVEGAGFTWYYIESPDGDFYYPLFNNAVDAALADELYGTAAEGEGSYHEHTFADEQPISQTWYMPSTYNFHAESSAPTSPEGIAWNEILTGDDNDYVPSQYNQSIVVDEGENINLQIVPAGDASTYSLSNIPVGLAYNQTTGYLQGFAPEVTGDNVANPSDEYTITVTKANAYGSSVGSLVITVNNTDAPATSATLWHKALKFSGGSEYIKQVTQSTASNALRMNGLSQLASANSDSSKTSNDTYSRPWATAIVFQTPNNTSNQHIWNSGEGTSTGSDNMYLRIAGSNGDLYFGWGREGVGYNEYHIGSFGGSYNQSTGQWWGIYISHDGTRLNSSNATAANLVNAFDIRMMATNDVSPVFSTLYNVGNDVNNWVSTGVRMDRTIAGDFTIGGRGANRSFHGRVASMVVTTLRKGVTKPTDAEIKLMLTDPMKWEDDYKDGQSARYGSNGNNFTYGPSNSNSKYATQIWLMGDGTNDSFANGIRNQVDPTDQNYTKIQFNSMQANDLETVNIGGLTE